MNGLMLFIVLSVNLFSAFLAGSGIRNLTQDVSLIIEAADTLAKLSGMFDRPTWHFLICLASAGVLQLAITAFWSLRSRAGGIMPLVIGLGASALSAWVSAAFLTLAGEEHLLRQQARLEAVAPARSALTSFSDSLRTTSVALQLVARQATELERVETTIGGTCPGNTDPGLGPRQRMRVRHAAVLATASAEADALAAEALQFDLDLQRANADDLAGVFARAVALSRSPRIASLRGTLAPIHTDLTEGWVDTGRTYTCPSPDFLATVDAALANLDSIVQIPTEMPVESAPSASDSSSLLSAAVIALIRGETPTSRLALYALGLASLIEMFQIGVIGMRERRLRALGLVPDGHDSFWEALPARGRKRQHLPTVLAALERYVWFDGKTDYFAMPVPSDAMARLPVSYFGMKLHHPSLRNFELDEIDPDWVESRNLGGRRFDLYALPKDLQRWRRVADRDMQAQMKVDG